MIATPVEFHYEQTKHFLKLGTNVFCENPGTLCSNSLRELTELSKKTGTLFYVDDILMYHDLKPPDSFVYKKWGGQSTNIIDRIAYHHFYLLCEEFNYKLPIDITIVSNEINKKIFNLEFEGKTVRFEYDFSWFNKKIDNASSTEKHDALKIMLEKVLRRFNFQVQQLVKSWY